MKTYKSKIGFGIVFFIAIIVGVTSAFMIINHIWAGLVINLVLAGFISYIFSSTKYIINGDELMIKCGFLVNTIIKIDTITKIAETNNPLSSPAASLDRIAIYYHRSDSVMISPREKMDFINQLTSMNNKIEVILK